MADVVRNFYDCYPYPPPVGSLEKYRELWQDSRRRRADFHLFWPDKPYKETFSILIAGCGTSQAAKHAVRWPSAQITAIDFSATSVRYTEELKRKHNLTNLEIHQLAIENAGQLRTKFDQIVCTGVLHHLADPDAGLAALRDILKPDGAMHLMVYAPYGRTGIYMLQEFCKRVGINPTEEGIQELIAALRELPPGHPLQTLLRTAPDFRQQAALADALLHPQDRAYSVPQLLDFIGRGKLSLLRWVKQAPYSARCGVMQRILHDSHNKDLSVVDEYAAAELFRGTMVRHSLIVRSKDGSTPRPISFVGLDWFAYVPVRMPETICIQERLPPGAAAVLINQTHTDTDLFLPITAAEKQLFDVIDGQRSIREICNSSGPSSPDAASAFFEKLWWHDQIVIDASSPH